MPCYDYDCIDSTHYDLMVPCDEDWVVYDVYGWDFLNQSWKTIGTEGFYEGAKEMADKYHKEMSLKEEEGKLGVLK
tara:strand:- start:1295 stop:1522 length:228 start_codon:yes stop_codon:yes gene_type:complete